MDCYCLNYKRGDNKKNIVGTPIGHNPNEIEGLS